jgi:hypothetical protein
MIKYLHEIEFTRHFKRKRKIFALPDLYRELRVDPDERHLFERLFLQARIHVLSFWRLQRDRLYFVADYTADFILGQPDAA